MTEPERTAAWTGGCLCGDVRYAVTGPLREIVACHCAMCRRWSGHLPAFTAAPAQALRQTGIEPSWYVSSPVARRGFCGRCGSSLFWHATGSGQVAIAAGSLDDPRDLTLARHIFTDDRAAYALLDDTLPSHPRGLASPVVTPPRESDTEKVDPIEWPCSDRRGRYLR